KKVILRDGRLTGAILLGDSGPAPRVLRAFHKNERLSENPAELIFPQRPGRPAHARQSDAVVSLPPEEEMRLKEVVAIIRPERWHKTKLNVESLGITAFTHHRVAGRGRQRGLQFLARRGAAPETGFRFLPKRMVSWIVAESQVETLVQAIMESNRTGQIGD